jgi:malate dehydrogenase
VEKNLADAVLFDIVQGVPQGKALDLMEAAPVEGHEKRVIGTNDYKDIEGAEIVVVTAGLPRKPGMTREDLLALNAKIITDVASNIKKYAPDSKVIVVTNPLDIMTHLAFKVTGFPEKRVFGMAGVLDTARMRYFIAERLGVVPSQVDAVVLGGHGDLMVPVSSHSKVNGKPVKDLIPAAAQYDRVHLTGHNSESFRDKISHGRCIQDACHSKHSLFRKPSNFESQMRHDIQGIRDHDHLAIGRVFF